MTEPTAETKENSNNNAADHDGYYNENEEYCVDIDIPLEIPIRCGPLHDGRLQQDDMSESSVRTGTKTVSDFSYEVQAKPAYENPVVAKREAMAVARTKRCLVLVLLLAVIAVTTTTYLLITNQEDEEFRVQFDNYASEVVSVAQQSVDSSFSAIEAFSVTISSLAKFGNMTWPFVTIPDFSARGQGLTQIMGANGLGMSHIVQNHQRQLWSRYSAMNVVSWYSDSIANEPPKEKNITEYMAIFIPTIWWILRGQTKPNIETDPGPWLPIWQSYPLAVNPLTNGNLLKGVASGPAFQLVNATKTPAITFLKFFDQAQSQLMQPIFEEVNVKDGKIVGTISVSIDWTSYFENILSDGSVELVMKNICNPEEDVVSYRIDGPDVTFLGFEDLHNTQYDDFKVTAPFVAIDYDMDSLPGGVCPPELSIDLYPTKELEESFQTNRAYVYPTVIVLIFGFTTFVFVLYDHFVNRRQKKVMDRIIKQDKIVSNMFPSALRDRLYKHQENGSAGGSAADNILAGFQPDELDGDDKHALGGGAPLAELFPSVTVIFADIAGFTAWSSAREPPQVFTLLEAIYGAFDKIAYECNVFKIETVGDCYVAAAGLPEPMDDHAVAAARFARFILQRMKELTRTLEVSLGPDTTDLKLRVGMNSGQVTAGVLRGQRARFQLFGDTMNIAARMETTSKLGHIQVSAATADLLKRAFKAKWIEPRSEPVAVKGKGLMQTYWLLSKHGYTKRSRSGRNSSLNKEDDSSVKDTSSVGSLGNFTSDGEDSKNIDHEKVSKQERLVEWNQKVLCKLLQQIVAARDEDKRARKSAMSKLEDAQNNPAGTVLEEFKPIITLKRFGVKDLEKRRDPSSVDLGAAVQFQLKDLLSALASRYRNNYFHNFEHASHVTASVRKLLSRIVSNDSSGFNSRSSGALDLIDLAGHSYGITSDPLTQFAVVFSAIIHDLDHPGVPNAQLVKEQTRNALHYKKSIAEQNSVDITWALLMSPAYKDLRACIYSNEEERQRFRQLVVNTVMATDIADKELQALRKARWEVAFSENQAIEEPLTQTQDRKATIVIEHLIQASDVSHTMQHWHIYKRWNEKLFMEMYSSYRTGRAESDPSDGWYKGEIGFFDFYVIPLAKKLQNCGVFGVSSHEYLNYAEENREEWIREGEKMVQEYIDKYNAAEKESSESN